MSRRQSWIVVVAVGSLLAAMAISAMSLARDLRFGLEFRGGYEIYCNRSSKPCGAVLSG